MKAAVCIKHGKPEGIEIRETPMPSIEKDEILLKIKATSVTAGDVALRKQSYLRFLLFWPLARLLFGIKNQRKRVLGHEFSGIVEKKGSAVTMFEIGDAVFGTTGFRGGAHAEYLAIPERNIIALKPQNLSFEEAAVLPIGGTCALHLLMKVNVRAGDKIMIYGASGSIGSYAVQLAKHFGAEVTGVCSTANIEMVKSLGADKVLDYVKEDFNGMAEKYDVIFDTVGKFPKPKSKKILAPKGRYISTHSSPVEEKQEYLDLILKLSSERNLKPVIDKAYSLDQIREAHTYVETGRKKGNVFILID